MARHRIFISATSRDLGSYRELAVRTLRERGYDTDFQPDFPLTHLEITTMLETRIAACDVVCKPAFQGFTVSELRREGIDPS